jgi:transcriptional regulator with XRE-family HTH domain
MKDLGRMLKQQRVAAPLTLRELANRSGVSASHLGRIERGERFPSARILRRIAKPLGFQEKELFTLAEFLSPAPADGAKDEAVYTISGLDRHVARVLAREPFEVQRCVIRILSILKSLAKSIKKEQEKR